MPVEFLNLQPQSDGDSQRRPPDGWTLVDPPHIYLSKIAEQWLENHGTKLPGVKYYLNGLPAGYRLFERPRPGNKLLVDKHLYGHPKGKFFDSPNRFYPHFEHLVKHGINLGCPCTVCRSTSAQAPPRKKESETSVDGASTVEKKFMTAEPPSKPNSRNRIVLTDEEGTPDAVSHLLDKLKLAPLDEEISEPSSMDWIASKELLKKWVQRVSSQPSWIPRQGEIVLFVRELSGTQIDFDRSDGSYKEFDEATNKFTRLPNWEAGVIAQDANELVNVIDLVEESDGKENSVTYSGFRIEPLLASTTVPERASKSHKYVPLHHIRPFMFWQRYLTGHPEDTWHPTITSGMKAMCTVCLVDKHRIRGTWPSADIFCTGVYIGSELLCIGDTVIMVPESGEVAQEFLRIDSVRLRLTNLEGDNNTYNMTSSPHSSTIVVRGKAFTLNLYKAWSSSVINQAPLKGLAGYEEDLFWLHDPSKSMEIPFSRVLGRCYDAESMLMWFPSAHEEINTTSVLSYGLPGLKAGRGFSTVNNAKILPGKSWFWGDSRLEVLGLESLNNIYASAFDDLREEKLEEWKYHHNKRKVGRPPKRYSNPMAGGVARALAPSGSENDERGSAEDEGMKKRSFDVAMRDEPTDQEEDMDSVRREIDRSRRGILSSSQSSAPDEDPLERFKKPKVVLHVEK